MKKILFTGYYGFQNFGDDLFGLACVEGLLKSGGSPTPVLMSPPIPDVDAQFLVPRSLGRLYRSGSPIGKALRFLFMVYGCLMYREVVLAGGSVIASGSSLRMRRLQYFLCRMRLCRLSAIGVSVGPFTSSKEREWASSFISRLSYLAVRDRASLDECARMGHAASAKLSNDLAGCVSFPEVDVSGQSDNVLGVSLCRYESIVGGNKHLEQVRNKAIFEGIAEFALSHKFRVRIVILNSNDDVGDVRISRELQSYLLNKEVVVELCDYVTLRRSLQAIASCNIFFSVRLHGAICAYLSNTPFVLVEYHKKCSDFLDYVGYGGCKRVSGIVSDKGAVLAAIESVLRSKQHFRISPPEYKKGSLTIFSASPWLSRC